MCVYVKCVLRNRLAETIFRRERLGLRTSQGHDLQKNVILRSQAKIAHRRALYFSVSNATPGKDFRINLRRLHRSYIDREDKVNGLACTINRFRTVFFCWFFEGGGVHFDTDVCSLRSDMLPVVSNGVLQCPWVRFNEVIDLFAVPYGPITGVPDSNWIQSLRTNCSAPKRTLAFDAYPSSG